MNINFYYLPAKYEQEIDVPIKIEYPIIGYKYNINKVLFPYKYEEYNKTHYVYIDIPIKKKFSLYGSYGFNKLENDYEVMFNYSPIKNLYLSVGYSNFDKEMIEIKYLYHF